VPLEERLIARYDPAMMSRRYITSFCLAGSLTLSACSSGAKKVPAPDAAVALATEAAAAGGTVVVGGIQRPWDPVRITQALAYCVSRQLNTPDDLLALAQEDCKGGTLAFYGQDNGIRYCPLFQPHRMTFICYPPVAAKPADQ